MRHIFAGPARAVHPVSTPPQILYGHVVAICAAVGNCGQGDNLMQKSILLTLLLASGVAHASEWVSLLKYPPPTAQHKWVKESLSREAFNCTDETHRTNSLWLYFQNGTNYSPPDGFSPSKWEPVPPNTILSTAMGYICAWEPK